ncbi:MAG: hypothetical protein ACUVYA_20090 [Planctomycetota bacterium]
MTSSSDLDRRAFLIAAGSALASVGSIRIRAAGPPPEARAATRGPKHHFFGYYDKCPWDASGRRLLAMEVDCIGRQPKPGEEIVLGTVELAEGDRFVPFARMAAWCWQEGTMLQRLPDAPDRRAIWNTIEGGGSSRSSATSLPARRGSSLCRSTPSVRMGTAR